MTGARIVHDTLEDLEPTHVEGFGLDYARMLREWARNLDKHAEALAGPERKRVWRLYLCAARRGFVSGFTSIFQVVAHWPKGPAEPTPSCCHREGVAAPASRRCRTAAPLAEPGFAETAESGCCKGGRAAPSPPLPLSDRSVDAIAKGRAARHVTSETRIEGTPYVVCDTAATSTARGASGLKLPQRSPLHRSALGSRGNARGGDRPLTQRVTRSQLVGNAGSAT